MIDRSHRLLDGADGVQRARMGALHHEDGQPEGAGGRDLAVGRLTAAVLGDENLDAAVAEQAMLGSLVERSAVENILCTRQPGVRSDRIDAAHDVSVLRRAAERRELLPADGKEHSSRCHTERVSGRRDARDLDPAIAFRSLPGRALQHDERHAGRLRGHFRVVGDSICERMGCIDQHVDLVAAHIVGETVSAAESPDADLARLRQRCSRTTGKRERDAERAAPLELFGKPSRFAGATQNENVRDRHGDI